MKSLRSISRKSLLEDLDEKELSEISGECWRSARAAHAIAKKAPKGVDGKPNFMAMETKYKQKMVLDYLLNVIQTQRMGVRIVEWADKNPGDMVKLIAASMPKEAVLEINVNHGVMIVPAKAANMEEWEENRRDRLAETIDVNEDLTWKINRVEEDV